jgi:hypothetical protein
MRIDSTNTSVTQAGGPSRGEATAAALKDAALSATADANGARLDLKAEAGAASGPYGGKAPA